MTMKEILSLMLALCILAVCLTACGSSDDDDDDFNTELKNAIADKWLPSNSKSTDNNSDDSILNNDEFSSDTLGNESKEEQYYENRLEQYYSAVFQYPSQNDEWTYNVYDCYIEITEYLGEAKEQFIIPDEIDGLPVWVYNTGFDYGDNSKVTTSVRLPEELLIIGESSFKSYQALENIELPEGLIKIEKHAFENCNSLNGNIILPASVQAVGERAFDDYFSNQSIELTVLNPECSLDPYMWVSVINGYAGSTAAQYAADKNIPFNLIEE